MKFFAIASALVAATAVSATTFTILVGENAGLTYNPSSINASVGDTVAFQFLAKNHSVTQSTFANPCTTSGVDSGFFPVAANATQVPEWSFTVNNASAPLWFFCAQKGHCGAGMVFAINANAAKSFEAFQAAANATASNTTGTGTGAGGSGTGNATTGAGGATASGNATGGAAASSALSKLSFNGAAGMLSAVGLLAGCLL